MTTDPIYLSEGTTHTVTWDDGIRVIMQDPEKTQRGEYIAYTQAYTATGDLANEGTLRFLDTADCTRFALRCAAVNGTGADEWNARFLLTGHHVHATVQENAARRRPDPLRRPSAPPLPYPIEALGPYLEPMAQALHATVQAPDAMCGQSVLAAGTLAVEGLADVVIDGRGFPVSNYFIDVGESGERKTAVDRLALWPHAAYQRALVRTFEHEKAGYVNDLEAYKAARGALLKGKGTREERRKQLLAVGAVPLPPLDPIIIFEEPTYEGLIKLLARGQPCLGLFSDEGGRFLGGHGMQDEQQQKTITGLCELWDGKCVTRVRATDESVILYGRRLALHLMIQPLVAHTFLSNPRMLELGLLSRCLVCWPTSTIGTRMYKAIDLTHAPEVQDYNTRMCQR